ncbi:MAG: SpoIID/LytB domain-containing protein [Clostridiales bacterium]|nr:SpoIID/LytB domain-containing protein [Clostridiales bacterium]
MAPARSLAGAAVLACAVSALLLLCAPAGSGAAAFAYGEMPESVRVGLYFDASVTTNKAVDSVSAYSESGLALSMAYGGYQAQASGREQALQRQQAWLQQEREQAQGQAQGQGQPQGQEQIPAYAQEREVHLLDIAFAGKTSALKLSKYSFASQYAAALGGDGASGMTPSGLNELARALGRNGIDSRLAYIDRWVLLAGGFGSQAEAESFIQASLAKDYGAYAPAPASLAGKYISVELDGVFQFVADVSAGSLRLAPIGASAGGASANAAAQSGAAPAAANEAGSAGGSASGSAGSSANASAGGSAAASASDSAGGPRISLNGKPYRGQIELVRVGGSDMTVVNILAMDDYLYGVVPREVQASSAEEALKAQAVAARTYTVNAMRKHASLGFDLCNTQNCQVYSSAGDEHERTTAAVDATSGKIVTWQGSPAQVFYFSSSGGATEDVKNVWGSTSFPYLASVPDEYESGNSLHYSWEAVYTAAEIQSRLLKNGVDIGAVSGVAITGVSAAGRATEVTITGSKGKKVYAREACRYFLEGIYSQLYTITTNGKSYQAIGASGGKAGIAPEGKAAAAGSGLAATLPSGGLMAVSGTGAVEPLPTESGAYRFLGKGWGHSVGMSQEGAKGMAAAGFAYAEILKHYFPGCAVE